MYFDCCLAALFGFRERNPTTQSREVTCRAICRTKYMFCPIACFHAAADSVYKDRVKLK